MSVKIFFSVFFICVFSFSNFNYNINPKNLINKSNNEVSKASKLNLLADLNNKIENKKSVITVSGFDFVGGVKYPLYFMHKVKEFFENSERYNFYTVACAGSFFNLGSTNISNYLIKQLQINKSIMNSEQIIFINHSNGCAYSYDLLSKVSEFYLKKIKIINFSGYSSIESDAILLKKFFFKILFKPIKLFIGETNILKVIKNSNYSEVAKNVPILLLHGNKDKVVDFSAFEQIKIALNDKDFKAIVALEFDADHLFVYRDEYSVAIKNIIKNFVN